MNTNRKTTTEDVLDATDNLESAISDMATALDAMNVGVDLLTAKTEATAFKAISVIKISLSSMNTAQGKLDKAMKELLTLDLQ